MPAREGGRSCPRRGAASGKAEPRPSGRASGGLGHLLFKGLFHEALERLPRRPPVQALHWTVVEHVVDAFHLLPRQIVERCAFRQHFADDAVAAITAHLLPLATVMTPNIPEAEALSGKKLNSRADVREAAKVLNGEYGCAVLVKGGHAVGDLAAAEDTLYDGKDFLSVTMPWIADPVSTHGTGCSLAAALAAELALGHDLKSAVEGAKDYVHQAIANSYLVGENCGVLGFAPRSH